MKFIQSLLIGSDVKALQNRFLGLGLLVFAVFAPSAATQANWPTSLFSSQHSSFANRPRRTPSGARKMSIYSGSSSEDYSSSRSSESDPPGPPLRSSAREVLLPRTQKPSFHRRHWVNRLCNIFESVYDTELSYLDPAVYENLSITCKPLIIADDGNYLSQPQPCFFAPLPQRELTSHPIDLDFCDEITGDIRHELKVSSEILTELAEEGLQPLTSALFPGNHLSWLFVECPREKFREKGKALTSLTSWRPR